VGGLIKILEEKNDERKTTTDWIAQPEIMDMTALLPAKSDYFIMS
jgi:hypothetical protein